MSCLAVGKPLLQGGVGAGFEALKFGVFGFGTLLHLGVLGYLDFGRRFGLELVGFRAFHALGILGNGCFDDGLLRFISLFSFLPDSCVDGKSVGLDGFGSCFFGLRLG